MIHLSTNYEPLREQIDYIGNHMLDCKSSIEAVAYLTTYRTFVAAYYFCTGEIYQDKKLNRNRQVGCTGHMKKNELFRKYHQNFLDNKSFHKEMFSSFPSLFAILDDYLESDHYIDLFQTYQKPFDEKKGEDIDILNQFFLEKDVVLKDIFEDLQRQGSIYLSPNVSFLENRPMTFLNSVENKVSLFIPPSAVCDVSFLVGLVHELGHVRDFFDLSSRGTKKVLQMYPDKSIFTEVLSVEHEMDFCRFLIDNDIHKTAAQTRLAYFYDCYFDGLIDAVLHCSIPDDCHLLVDSDDFTRKEVASLIESETNNLDSWDDTLISDRFESLQYSYGFLLAPLFSNHPQIREQFLTFRHDSFDPLALTSIGVTPENVAQEAKALMKTYFKS